MVDLVIRVYKSGEIERGNFMKEVTIKVYEFDELSEDAKRKAETTEIISISNTDGMSYQGENHSFIDKAWKRCEELRTPWFLSQYLWEYGKEQILAELRCYWYTEDGNIFSARGGEECENS